MSLVCPSSVTPHREIHLKLFEQEVSERACGHLVARIVPNSFTQWQARQLCFRMRRVLHRSVTGDVAVSTGVAMADLVWKQLPNLSAEHLLMSQLAQYGTCCGQNVPA